MANELIRRTQALLLAETHNAWGYADVLESDRPKEIVRPHLLHAVQRDRERLKKLQGGGSSSGGFASGDAALKIFMKVPFSTVTACQEACEMTSTRVRKKPICYIMHIYIMSTRAKCVRHPQHLIRRSATE